MGLLRYCLENPEIKFDTDFGRHLLALHQTLSTSVEATNKTLSGHLENPSVKKKIQRMEEIKRNISFVAKQIADRESDTLQYEDDHGPSLYRLQQIIYQRVGHFDLGTLSPQVVALMNPTEQIALLKQIFSRIEQIYLGFYNRLEAIRGKEREAIDELSAEIGHLFELVLKNPKTEEIRRLAETMDSSVKQVIIAIVGVVKK